MKDTIILLAFCCFTSTLFSQINTRNLAIEAFLEDIDLTKANVYDETKFGDVYPFDPNGYLERGRKKMMDGFSEEAQKDFSESIRLAEDCGICYYYRGINYMGMDSLQQAKADLKKAIHLSPLLIEAYNDLGVIYTQENNLDSAVQTYQEGINKYPNFALIHLNLARINIIKERWDKALGSLKTALEIEPCHKESLSWSIVVHLIKNQNFRANKQLDKAIACNSEEAEWYYWKSFFESNQREWQRALGFINEAIEKDEDAYAYYFRKGIILEELNDFVGAVDNFTTAFTRNSLENPDYDGGRQYRNIQIKFESLLSFYGVEQYDFKEEDREKICKIIAYSITEKRFEANLITERLLRKYPEKAFLHYLHGVTLERKWEIEKAMEEYSKSISLKDDFSEAYKRRGVLRFQADDTTGAIADFNAMYAKSPHSFEGLKYRGLARVLAGNYKLGLVDLEYYYKKDTADMEVLFYIGRCKTQLTLHQEALNTWKKYVAKTPKNAQGKYELAYSYLMNQDTAQAILFCDSVIIIDGCHPQAANLKGYIYMQQAAYEDAISIFDEGLECFPDFSDGLINRSICQMKIGKNKAALAGLNQVIRTYPNNAFAYYLRGKLKEEFAAKSACPDIKKAIKLGMEVSKEEIVRFCDGH